jgi:hypothetical protein
MMTFSRSLRGALSHFRTHALTHSRTVLLLLLSAGALPARAAAQDTPEQVVERYYQTFQSGDYAGNAALMHPGALEELKTTLLGMAALPGATEQPQFREMFGVGSIEEMRALPAQTLFERVLRNQLEGEMRAVLASARVNVLGHVTEGDSTAHVVYRMHMEFGGQTMEQVQVVPLVRVNGQWRVLLTGSLAGMMNAMPGGGPP